ncbi:serine/threonine-protein kinase [Streptomyces sp. NPDC005017]|uniref:serine/threonine-protein kinase n=1 Tax=Streptomyces sp. NPDC005017 TaxID=3364706 RepID=UPI0036771DF1
MGTVYAALTDDGDRLAVKVIHPVQAADPEFRARFRREVRLSARVRGPFLLPLLEADPDADTPWLATEYAPGPTLADHLAANGPLTDGTLYAFATATAQALAAIHATGIVHRDVKPQNVLLTPAGPRVLDFGIAHAADGTSVTRTGVLTGTPGWISPEHYRSGVTAAEGDVFAWGALVAYAATGRLPFGTGAPEAVAYRVISGSPDLDGIPEALREVLEQALAKEPAERPAAAEAAEDCAQLLAAQSTLLFDGHTTAATGNAQTLVADLVPVLWSIPAPEDPPWPLPASAPPRKPLRRKAIAAVLVATAVIGASAGGFLASRDDRSKTDTVSPSGETAPTASTGTPEPRRSSVRTSTVVPGTGTTSQAATDPRAIPVPADPLAGVNEAAFTRADDETQPVPGEWRASHRADDTDEQQAAADIADQVTAMLATKDMSFMTPTVTYNRQAQTLMVTGGPISTLTDDYKEVFRRASEMAACVTLAHRLKEAPTSWPYGRFSVYWKDYEGQDEATILGFGQATTGCYSEEAGRPQGSDAGLTTAELPSSDKNEIRIAGDTVKAITTAWDTRIAEGHGLEHFDRDDAITLGFDPVERMMYVWAWDGSGALVGRAQQSHFQDVVTQIACPKLLAEYNTNTYWNYTRWTIAAYQGNSAWPQLFASGDCLPTESRP